MKSFDFALISKKQFSDMLDSDVFSHFNTTTTIFLVCQYKEYCLQYNDAVKEAYSNVKPYAQLTSTCTKSVWISLTEGPILLSLTVLIVVVL